MTRLRTAAMVCSVVLAASAAMAQQDAPAPPPDGQQQVAPPNGPMRTTPEQRVAMMQRRLQLSESQTAQVRTILAESQAKMEALRANGSLAPQDRRAQMEEMRNGMQAKIRGVLTPDQQAKFDEMQAKMREKQKERRANAQSGDEAPAPAEPPAPQQ